MLWFRIWFSSWPSPLSFVVVITGHWSFVARRFGMPLVFNACILWAGGKLYVLWSTSLDNGSVEPENEVCQNRGSQWIEVRCYFTFLSLLLYLFPLLLYIFSRFYIFSQILYLLPWLPYFFFAKTLPYSVGTLPNLGDTLLFFAATYIYNIILYIYIYIIKYNILKRGSAERIISIPGSL